MMEAKHIFRGLSIVLLLVVLGASPAPAQAADCTWLGGSGNWSNPANWSGCGGGVPGPADSATISAGTVTVDAPVTINSLVFSGGVINGSQPLTVTGNALFDGGVKTIAGITFNNEGTAVWSAGTLVLGPWPAPVIFNNQAGATFEIAGALNTSPSQSSAINNYGTILKTGSGLSNIADFGAALMNAGLIRVEQGTLRMYGFTSTHSGAFEVLENATIQFDGGLQTFGPTSSFSGDGNVTFYRSGGSHVFHQSASYNIGGRTSLYCFNCAVRIHNQAVTGELALIPWETGYPQLEGQGSLTVTGLTIWQQGVIGHTGNYINTGPITVNMLGGLELHTLVSIIQRDAIVRNHGEAIYTGGSFYLSHETARFENLPGATFTIPGSRDLNYYWNAQDQPLGRFVNQGSLVKTGSGAATITSLIVENSGLIDVQEGSLLFQRRTGSTNVNGGARLILQDGQLQSAQPLVFSEYARLQGSGTLQADVEAAEQIAPGFSTTPWTPGLITVDGNLTLGADSRLLARLVSSTTPGSGHDQVAVTGQAHLAGTLEVRLADGYSPAFNAEFDLLTCGLGCNGSFENTDFSPSADDYDLQYEANSVSVRWVGETTSTHTTFLPLLVR